MTKPRKFNLRFLDGPGPEGARFIECETINGESFSVGLWEQLENGQWLLKIDCTDIYEAGYKAGEKSERDFPRAESYT